MFTFSMIYMLDQEMLLTNPDLKKCLFAATSIAKNSDKEKYVSSGYRMTFDSAGSWSFVKDCARNVVIFGVDNSSSSRPDNRKNNFSVLGEGPTYMASMEAFG